MKNLKAVFFDFDGVLCTDYFYTTLRKNYPDILEFINKEIFRSEQKYSDRWMRGEFSYDDINKMVSKATGISMNKLTELFIESIKLMRINKELLELAQNLKKNGVQIALVTNNMDVFNEVTVPHNSLDKVFPAIVNSSDHGAMKHEQNGKLFDLALQQLGLDSFKNVLLMDDSEKACKMFESKGGMTYLFHGVKDFEVWSRKNLKIDGKEK
jgi:FMN phosphatase YigB (HAD superfamily)